MPSPYRPESRGDPYDTSRENLRKAFVSKRYHPPRPWRSKEEQLMVRRLTLCGGPVVNATSHPLVLGLSNLPSLTCGC